jgi:hypothetical protein
MTKVLAWTLALCASAAFGQEPEPPEAPVAEEAPFAASNPFRLGGEIKAGFRHSTAEESPVFFPFPPDFLPPGETQVFMRTPDPGSSLEVQYLGLSGEGDLTSGVFARFEVRILDLYNRNPTSSDDRIFVRQAYVRFGGKPEPLDGQTGARFYALVGMAPRFTKQMTRRLESYGLWGTAVSRFEQLQLELGAALGPHVYLRGMVGNGNPVFFRDTNALAGDNGTPERQPGNVRPVYQSGFPILYDAKATDVNFASRFEWGGGVGAHFGGGDGAGIDVLGWYFTRRLAEAVDIRGTTYSGDIKLLQGVAFPLPYSGDRKRELGVNLQSKWRGLRVFAQYVDQDIADLRRRGLEAEASWTLSLNGLFLVGESPFGNWLQPVFRFSWIDNLFTGPREYPALSVLWDWRKYDLGLRFGLVRNVDLTAEYTHHFVDRPRGGSLPMHEFLLTLRAGF